MISVNQLIQQAFEAVSMVDEGESVDGTYAATGLAQLNLLIAELNNQEYLASQIRTVDMQCVGHCTIAADGRDYGYHLNAPAPEQLRGVSLKTPGGSWLPLGTADRQTIDTVGSHGNPTIWTYELSSNEEGVTVGTVIVDSDRLHTLRLYYSAPMPRYELDGEIAVSDLYYNLLLTGLAYRLCRRYKLKEYMADAETDFTTAKSLIKRSTYRQRASVNSIDSYNSSYQRGLSGEGW